MLTPHIPENDTWRLATLRALHILDTPREKRFDRITRLAQTFFQVPIAAVSFIDEDRQWFKPVEGISVCQVTRDVSFCAHTLLQKDLFLIPDTTLDSRFYDQPFVTSENGIRFYAGYPLFALNGDALGSFCIIDTKPRYLTEEEIQTLKDMAAWVEQEINAEQISQAFMAQRESEARIHAIIESTSEAMLLVSPTHEYLMMNKRFSEFFAIPEERILHGKTEEIIPIFSRLFADPEQMHALTVEMLENSQKQYSMFVMQQSPQHRDLELFSTPVYNDDGMHLGRLFIYRDVTQRRVVEHRTNEFIAHVSHELRTPLTAIKGYIDLFVEDNVGPLNDLQHDLLKTVQNNTDRLIALINDMLDISRIDAGKIELRRRMIDLTQLIRDVAILLQSQIDAKHQTLTLTLSESLPQIMGDINRLTQVFTNLLSNAHQYTPEGGHITITTEGSADFIRIMIQDTGIGLSMEDQANLFTRFFRVQNNTTQQVDGTGLGLSITQSIVKLHQGKIEVSSTPGHGSKFTVHLPTVEYMKSLKAEKRLIEVILQ